MNYDSNICVYPFQNKKKTFMFINIGRRKMWQRGTELLIIVISYFILAISVTHRTSYYHQPICQAFLVVFVLWILAS